MTSEELYKVIGRRIAEARKSMALSQSDLANHVQLTRTAISSIESGRQSLSLHLFIDLCKFLALDPARIMCEVTAQANGLHFPEGTEDEIRNIVIETLNR